MRYVPRGIIVIFFIAILSVIHPALIDAVSENPDIRVLIFDNKKVVHVSIKDSYKICALDSGRVLSEGEKLSAKFTYSGDGIMMDNKEFKMRGLKIISKGVAKIYVDGRLFRGNVDIVNKDSSLMVINHIPMEEYLYGVLFHEVSHKWPIEALKVQAIASRTFALYQSGQNRLKPYDVRSDIYSQVYGGSNSERWSTNMAVDATKGKVLAYKGELFPAYFHATCAGHTEDASNLWRIDTAPLHGSECGYCFNSKYAKWVKEIPLWSLEEMLNKNGYKITKIISVSVISKNKSGRADKVLIKDASGASLILTGKDLRSIIGPNELRSTKFNVFLKLGSLIFEGEGWGHGVGMCQWGAYGMAIKGKKAPEILKRYYPGSEIIPIEKIRYKN